MTIEMILTPSRRLALGLSLCLFASVSVANAETNRQGFYAGIELGFANAADMGSVLSAVNHPTKCDSLVGGDPTGPGCADDSPETLTANSFDLGTGFLGGVSVGYALDRFRVEFEYVNRSHGGDSLPWKFGGNVIGGKVPEVSEIDPPSERVSDFSAHQFFVNAYYDFLNDSRWTPYVGAGVGWARTNLDYQARLLRKTIAQGYPADNPAAAAGTLSLLDTGFTDTLFGFQFLGGLDYALTDKVSIGMKARWASFQDLEGDTVWDLIRSHRPVRADGQTPFDSALTFSDIQYWAISVGLKYAF
ncbi:MAG: porin family protein [Nitrospira sp. SB0672_bin_25]|nr:porin family protein [Nitrospira sp. SB0666_bin_27]MYC27026.1 porin family protein [Nitrospira sp. SB0662_bin_26]MYF24032.1 porin family protein [Nitrospira sp. SB0678_bin_10]MYJ54686.1 porin family protein [Nitrospira sp. SB0672_bin_25]